MRVLTITRWRRRGWQLVGGVINPAEWETAGSTRPCPTPSFKAFFQGDPGMMEVSNPCCSHLLEPGSIAVTQLISSSCQALGVGERGMGRFNIYAHILHIKYKVDGTRQASAHMQIIPTFRIPEAGLMPRSGNQGPWPSLPQIRGPGLALATGRIASFHLEWWHR